MELVSSESADGRGSIADSLYDGWREARFSEEAWYLLQIFRSSSVGRSASDSNKGTGSGRCCARFLAMVTKYGGIIDV